MFQLIYYCALILVFLLKTTYHVTYDLPWPELDNHLQDPYPEIMLPWCSIFIDRSHRNSSYLLMNLKFIQYQKVFEMMFRKKTGRSSKSQNRSSCFRNWTSRSCWKNCHPEYQDTRNSREVPITSFWVQRFSFNFQQLPSHQMLSSNKSLSWNCTGLTEYHPHNIFYFPQSSYLPKSPS